MRYIEMRAYVQGSAMLPSGELPAPFERDIKVRSFYSVPEQCSFIAIEHLRQPRRLLFWDTIKGTSWSVKQSYLWPFVSKSDILQCREFFKSLLCLHRGADKSLARPTSRCILYIYVYIYI